MGRERLALRVIASGALAVAGGILYLLIDSGWAWWVGIAMVMPFAFIVAHGARGRTNRGETDGGAWGPP